MQELTAHERFLAGLPLSDENADLMEGREPALAFPPSITGESKANPDELTAADIAWLRRLIYEPGWEILLRILRRSMQKREDGAKVLSSSDPLSNKEQIANAWAYVACYKQVMLDIEILILNTVGLQGYPVTPERPRVDGTNLAE